MTEDYDILKGNNLRQLIAEYEQERTALSESRAKHKQYCREYMKERALQEIEEEQEKHDTDFFDDGPISWSPSDFRRLIREYTEHVYSNAKANLVRKYAIVYDAKNIDKYSTATPLPRIQDVMDNLPKWMSYQDLKELATHCPRWRQR